MTRSRAVLLTSFTAVLAGSALAVGALVLDPARAAVGPLPGEALALPADTRVVMGIDMHRFVASPFYRRYAKKDQGSHLEALRRLEEETGLDPERDIERIVIASRGGGSDEGVVLVSGRFDRHKLARAIETKGAEWKKVEGETVYLFDGGRDAGGEGRGAAAIAFLDEGTLAIGKLATVEQLVTNRSRNEAALENNRALLALVEQVKPGSVFWMAGDQAALRELPGQMGGATGTSVTLPALQSVIVTAELDPMLAVQLTGFTADEASAKNLADVVRGLVALATMQAAQKPELRDLGSAISVTTEASKVRVNASFPYELLDALQAQRPPRAD